MRRFYLSGDKREKARELAGEHVVPGEGERWKTAKTDSKPPVCREGGEKKTKQRRGKKERDTAKPGGLRSKVLTKRKKGEGKRSPFCSASGRREKRFLLRERKKTSVNSGRGGKKKRGKVGGTVTLGFQMNCWEERWGPRPNSLKKTPLLRGGEKKKDKGRSTPACRQREETHPRNRPLRRGRKGREKKKKKQEVKGGGFVYVRGEAFFNINA